MGDGELRFGDLTIDTAGVLRRQGVRVPLQPQPARLLLLLVQRAGEVVTRDDIRLHIWGDTNVEFDQNINYCVRQIRSALGDAQATLVQTVPRRGYRFTGSGERHEPVRRMAWPRRVAAAAALTVAFGSGFWAGSSVPPGPHHPVTFVYRHVTGEANCPYLRFLSSFYHSS